MLNELEPIWNQLQETYDAVREALADVPDDRLHWRPGPSATTVAGIVQHLARANVGYANMIEHAHLEPRWQPEEQPGRDRLLERLDQSRQRAHDTFARMTPEALRLARADRWNPLGPAVTGPLDALWFALQMVRHSAYHLGQINLYLLIWEGEQAG